MTLHFKVTPEGENSFIDSSDFGEKLSKFLKRNAIKSGDDFIKCLYNY